MATFQSLDARSLNQAALDTSNRDSFSTAFESDFASQQPKNVKYSNPFSSNPQPYSQPGFDVNPMAMENGFSGDSTVHAPSSNLTDPLKLRLPLSPPGSATVSPKQWPYGGHTTFPNDIFATQDATNFPHAQYGQMTPPEDENETLPGSSLNEHLYGSMAAPSEPSNQHNLHTDPAIESQQRSKSKRNRKTTRGPKKHSPDSSDPNDVRRTKFLERNRVAASKCRQKKKEWTQNLEGRARDLQSENNSLRLWLESLRDEYMYLKTQIAEHRTCDSREINEYLDDPKRDLMALNNPASRNILESMRRHSIKQEFDDDGPYPQTASVTDDEDALGTLLADSMNETTAS